MWRFTSNMLLLLAISLGSAIAEEIMPQSCDIGPLNKTYGNTPWFVYSCNNDEAAGNARLALISAPGNPAMPFVFIFHFKDGSYHLVGEGQGSKEASDAALNELQKLTQSDIAELIIQTKQVQRRKEEINITSDSAPGWLPSAYQRAAVPQVIQNFLAMLDSGRYVQAYDLMTEGMKKLEPYDGFVRRLTEFNDQAGPVKVRRIVKITWTKDPANAPAAGIYAAVDLVSRFANIERHCGYIVLYQRDSQAPFLVAREEENFMTNFQARKIELRQSRQAVDETWAQISRNCPNYKK